MQKFNYIIVGAGLAGTILAEHFLTKNKSVLVIDNNQNHSSKVAAGIINPIVFKRITKSWKIDDLLPKLTQFYTDFEQKHNISILEQIDMVKIFNSFEEQNDWLAKTQDEGYSTYIKSEPKSAFFNDNYHQKFGYGVVKNAARLDINIFLDTAKNIYKSNNSLLEESFNYNALDISKEGVKYKNYSAEKIIFCEGYKLSENPWFSYLKLIKTKGEILNLIIKDYDVDFMLNRGFFMYPHKDKTYTVGSTYSWHDESLNTTEKAKEELLEKVSSTLNQKDISVNKQLVGIRPTTEDHRPLIGQHPQHKNLYIFNGLGTKGVMIAPYFAEQLANHLEENVPLYNDFNIKRFNN